MTQIETMKLIKRLDEKMYDKMLEEYIEDGVTYTRDEIKAIYNTILAKKKAVTV